MFVAGGRTSRSDSLENMCERRLYCKEPCMMDGIKLGCGVFPRENDCVTPFDHYCLRNLNVLVPNAKWL